MPIDLSEGDKVTTSRVFALAESASEGHTWQS